MARSVWAACAGVLLVCSVAGANPVATNIYANQRQDNSGLVDIHYDLSGGTGLCGTATGVAPYD